MHKADASEWSPEIAEESAAGAGLVLSGEHWKAITCWRELTARFGRVPMLAELKCCGFTATKLNELFPGDVRTVLSNLAGVPE